MIWWPGLCTGLGVKLGPWHTLGFNTTLQKSEQHVPMEEESWVATCGECWSQEIQRATVRGEMETLRQCECHLRGDGARKDRNNRYEEI